MLILALVTLNLKWVGGALLAGYTFAWIGHFIFEKNRPATFNIHFGLFFSDGKCGFSPSAVSLTPN